eukprot:IDg23579t1
MEYERHPESSRIPWGLATSLYIDEREQSFATSQLKGGNIAIQTGSTQASASVSPSVPQQSNSSN